MDKRTERLIEAFNRSELTQVELCKATGITKGALSSYLSGRYFPKQQAIEKLASALNVSVYYLMGLDEPSSSSDSQAAVPADPGEERLLYLYRGLNSVGQTKLNEYAGDLSANEKYQLRVHDVVSESSPTYGINIDNSDLPMVAETQAKYGDEAI